MINTKKFAVAVAFGLSLCVVASPALAAVTFSRTAVDNAAGGAPLAGFVTNDIKITFDGQYTGAQALIELTGGATPIYQDAAGNAVPPSAFFVGLVPSIAFDTFTAQGSALSGGANGEPSLGGGAVDLGGAPVAVFTNALINQAWNPAGGVTIVDQTNFLIGRFSLSNTANGTAKFLASAAGQPITIEAAVQNGCINIGGNACGGAVLPVVNDLGPIVNNLLNATVGGTVTGTDVATWDPTLTFLDYTIGFGGVPGAPGLALAASFNPATQAFSWDTTGSTRGTYRWQVSGSNGANSDTGIITVEQHAVPEPATLSLIGLAVAGFVGFARRRS